jgi:uncharacterized membrane protein YkvI
MDRMTKIKQRHVLGVEKISSMIVFFLILIYLMLIFSIFSCQKAGNSEQFETKESHGKKGEYQEYIIKLVNPRLCRGTPRV